METTKNANRETFDYFFGASLRLELRSFLSATPSGFFFVKDGEADGTEASILSSSRRLYTRCRLLSVPNTITLPSCVQHMLCHCAVMQACCLPSGTCPARFVTLNSLELVRPKGRVFISLLFNTMFILGGVTVTLLAWWLQNWRYLIFIIYTPAVFVFIYIWILPESFRWLLSKGRYEEAIKVLSKSERMNNVIVPKDHYIQVEKQAMKQRHERKNESKEQNQSTFNQLLTSAMIWKRLFICSFLWISSTLVYYGLSINAIELSGNSYLNYIVVLVIEAPANVCKLIFLDRYGRKKVIATAFCLTGLILIAYAFVPVGSWSLVVYLGGKFFITLAYNSLYVFAAEVFPTNYRTSLLAMCSTIGRIGSTLAPQTPLLTKYYEYLPTMVFAGMATLSAFLVLVLPETNNMKLPDSLKEAQDQDKKPSQQTSTNTTEPRTIQIQEKYVESSEENVDNEKKTRL